MTHLQTLAVATVLMVLAATRAPGATAKLGAGDACAYSPLLVGQNGVGSNRPLSLVTDIREIIASNGLTVGYLYRLADGTATLQGNALMSATDVRRYHLTPHGDGPLWTGVGEIDPRRIRERIVSCRPDHVEHAPVHGARVERDAARAYRAGKDYIPDSNVR